MITQRQHRRPTLRASAAATIGLLLALPIAAQQPPTAAPDTAPPRAGSEFLVPAGSLLLPGLGQYLQGATGAGLAYSATALAGVALSTVGDAFGDEWQGDLPRRPRDQFAEQAGSVAFTAASLSAWDAFHRAMPRLQHQGKYDFLGARESVGDLLSAPFDPRFLRRWTTWVDLAQTLLVTGLILAERDDAAEYVPFRGHDAAYTASLSLNAAVGEEAMFRGWLLPLLHQKTGQRFWIANGLQAGLFGAAHLPDASWFAAWISAWAMWEGWLTQRNDWSIRESIFHHFWYDVAVVTASLLIDESDVIIRINFPPIRF